MDKNKELAKNTAIITVGKICTQFMSFFLMPLYTGVLSTEEYGIVDLIVTYTSLFLPLVLLQVDQALFRFLVDVRKNEEGKKGVISTAIIFAVCQSVVILIIFCALQPFISVSYKWFLLLNILTSVCANMMLQTARGLGDNVAYALATVISASSQIFGNILLLLFFKMGVYGMLFSAISAHVLTAVFIFIKKKIYRYISLKHFNYLELKQILRYSLPLVPNQLCWWILNASDRSIVLLFLGASFNGLLSVGHKFSSVYIIFYNIFNLSWTESAALHMEEPDRDEFFAGVITNMFKFFMCIAIGIVACMPFVFPLLVNSKFNGAYNIIPIFMLSAMFHVVVSLYSVVYIVLKKTREVAKTSIIAGCINVVVHLGLVKIIGLYAAAVSTAVAFGIMAVYRYFDVKKYIYIKFPFRWMVVTSVMFAVTCVGYYSNQVLLQVGILLIVILVSIVMNKNLLYEAISIASHKVSALRRGH